MNAYSPTSRAANPEEVSFQVDRSSLSSFKQGLSPEHDGKSPMGTRRRADDYMIREEEEEGDDDINSLAMFSDPLIKFDFEGETIMYVKDSRGVTPSSQKFIGRLERLSKKLSKINNELREEEPESLWRRCYYSLKEYLTPLSKRPRHHRINKVVVSLNSCSELDDEGIKALTTFISTMERVTHLEFEVKNTGATDQSLALMSSLLGNLKQLTYFYVDFSGCQITNEGLYILANTLKEKVNIQEVWLRFSWCKDEAISNEGLTAISKSLEHCKQLQVLLLEFNGQSQIASKGLSSVLTAVQKSASIKKLYMYFERSQASDNFLTYAGETLPKLKRLEVFGLNLSNSNYITAKGIEKLEKGLQNAGSIRQGLYLYLGGVLGMVEREKMKKNMDALNASRKLKAYVVELE